ncbi:TIGR03943 family putative permease subunit [Paenibacillus sp. GCM10023252]|uniref:TIGR03943 family putative permease subunit n=1 Tax=Paenibacillus sp. GCM10023252 TaxID=3252649 RepID=UPI003611F297
MMRFFIMFGFALMFYLIHLEGNLNKYINTKYAYLSIIAIVVLSLLSLYEFVRVYRLEKEAERRAVMRKADGERASVQSETGECSECCVDTHVHRRGDGEGHDHCHDYAHNHNYDHGHDHDDHHGHSHEPKSQLVRNIGYLVLLVPILTGILLPVQTLDSSFVKAKGFSFPILEASADNPGQHQFLKPDTSIYYGADGYEEVKNKELAEFLNCKTVNLSDDDYLKGMEVIYNYPGRFMGKTISFDGFIYRGEQASANQYFVFRFGFIHCAADSGVFGMLAEFPQGTQLPDDKWVHVTGRLSSMLYQPFKQTIPMLQVTEWKELPTPQDPYVYRKF